MTGGKAIILFGHGSRDPLWRRPMESVMQRLQARRPGLLVCCAYLELDQPDLPGAVAQVVNQGAAEVTIVPMFMSARTCPHWRTTCARVTRQRALPCSRLLAKIPASST
jgi:hypothetical protein